MAHQIAVAVYRVSTDKQGVSGLGLEGQRAAVHAFLGREPDRSFTVIETGKRGAKRLELQEAIAYCKAHNGRLVLAKLDRLAPTCTSSAA